MRKFAESNSDLRPELAHEVSEWSLFLWISVGPGGPHIFNRTSPLSFIHNQVLNVPFYHPITAHRMYHSFPGMDQYSWSEIPDLPFYFPLSPTASNRSRGTPQIHPNPYDSTSTTSDENRFEESHGPYAPPCTAISTPPGKGDVSDAFNSTQLYSVNAGLPPGSAGQALSRQQIVFGDAQSPFALDIDGFWPTPAAYENHTPAPTTSLFVHDPPLPLPPSPPSPPSPTDRTSFSPRSQPDDPISSAPPTLSGSVSTRGDSACQEGPEVTAALPNPRPIQQSSGRPSRKRKTDQLEVDSDDGPVGTFLFFFSHPMLNFLGNQVFASLLHDGEAGEPGPTFKIRWA